MKKMFLLVIGAGMLVLTGCGHIHFDSSYVSPLDAFPQSRIPSNPVRRSESWSRYGNYSYFHSQGTHNSVSRTWSPYGVQETVVQETYSNTSESQSPPTPYVPVLVDAPFTYPQGGGSVGGGRVLR